MSEKETFVFQLSEKLKYTPEGQGEFSETASIEFSPPTMEVWDEVTDLNQLVARAFMGLSNLAKKPEKDAEDVEMKAPSASEMKLILSASESVAFKDIANAFKALAVKTGKLDSKTYMKVDHFKSLSIDDAYEMVCGYIANFIVPSLFPETEGKEIG